jgi:eukaryotic-like serine/threonine-protein kinase
VQQVSTRAQNDDRTRSRGRRTRRNDPGPRAASTGLGEGRHLFERYELEQRIGRGGMAEVWRAHDERLDRPVAIKILAPHLLPDESWRRRFVAEARAASGLTHPGIVPVYDVIDDRKTPAIVFQYIDGETLADRLRRVRVLPLAEATRIAGEVAEALDHAHRAGVIHRDVKPANILLEADDGRARLVDFGIARVIDDARAELTGAHEVLGTLRYMAPEQLAGQRSDARTDLYALGLVIVEMVPDLEAAPAWLRELVAQLRAPDPKARPGSAGDVARALETGTVAPDRSPAGANADGGAANEAGESALDPDAPTLAWPAVARAGEEAIRADLAAPAPAEADHAPAAAAAAAVPVAAATPVAVAPSVEPPAPSTAARVTRRPRSGQTDYRQVAIGLLVAGALLAGIAVAGNLGRYPGSGPAGPTRQPVHTAIPTAAPANEPPKPPKGHDNGHGNGHGG